MRTAEIALAAARNRLRILGRSDEEIEKLEKSRSHRRRDHGGRADRRHGDPAPGRPRPVHQHRRHRPGLHGRRPVDRVADRQRARIGCAQDEGRRAGRGLGAGLSGPHLQRQALLRGAGARSQHPPPAGARRDRQPRPRAAARDVRLLPHRLGRQPADAGGAAGGRGLRGRAGARLGGAARPEVGGHAADRGRRHHQRPRRGPQRPAVGETVVASGTLFIDRAATRD